MRQAKQCQPILVAMVSSDRGYPERAHQPIGWTRSGPPSGGGGGGSPRLQNALLVLTILGLVAFIVACEALT